MLEHYILCQQKYAHTYYLSMMRVICVHKFVWVCVTFKWTPTGTARLKNSFFLFVVIEHIELVPQHFITSWSWMVQPNFCRGVQEPRKINILGTYLWEKPTILVLGQSCVDHLWIENSYQRNLEWCAMKGAIKNKNRSKKKSGHNCSEVKRLHIPIR